MSAKSTQTTRRARKRISLRADLRESLMSSSNSSSAANSSPSSTPGPSSTSKAATSPPQSVKTPPPPTKRPRGFGDSSNPSSFVSSTPTPFDDSFLKNCLSGPDEEDSDILTCPICLDLIEDAYMTSCGHSFCHKCITRAMERCNRCPKCCQLLGRKDMIYPNFSLNTILSKKRQWQRSNPDLSSSQNVSMEEVNDLLKKDLDIRQVNVIIDKLMDKKHKLEFENKELQYRLLAEFLSQLHDQKYKDMMKIKKQLDAIKNDEEETQSKLEAERKLVYSGISSAAAAAAAAVASANNSNLYTVPSTPTAALTDTDKPSTSHSLKSNHINIASNSGDSLLLSHRALKPEPMLQYLSQPDLSCGGVDDSMFFTESESASPASSSNAISATNSSAVVSMPSPFYASRLRMESDEKLQLLLAYKKARVERQFEDLADFYLNMRGRDSLDDTTQAGSLDDFRECLSKATMFSGLRSVAKFNYCADTINSSNIVSSIEFDRDNEFFAIAGVQKKIKIFDYRQVIEKTGDDGPPQAYPYSEMSCKSKISSVAWNAYFRTVLASSDYEGVISVWDVNRQEQTQTFHEHEKRCWSVNFNKIDHNMLASGSDDHKVKIWATDTERSVMQLEAKANICCVEFCPQERHYLVFGSADHCVHYYDLRQTKQAVTVFKGHRKAVSYSKFVDSNHVVSASTDSTLRLWDIKKEKCERVLHGHTNEKNFVGLSTDGQYIACGSENNHLYVYYKGFETNLWQHKFESNKSVLDKELREDDTSEFVSAVCWKPKTTTVLAANSKGSVKVLELF